MEYGDLPVRPFRRRSGKTEYGAAAVESAVNLFSHPPSTVFRCPVDRPRAVEHERAARPVAVLHIAEAIERSELRLSGCIANTAERSESKHPERGPLH